MALLHAARQVVLLTTAHFCLLLLLGTGVLLPPEQRSLMPPSLCVAPHELYERIALLNYFFAPAAIGSISLAGFVACHHQVAAAGAGAGAVMLRALTVMAVAMSATSAGIAMVASFLILQVKAGNVSCFSSTLRLSVYGSYLVIGPILLLAYVDVARMALSHE